MQMALRILRATAEHNSENVELRKKFQVRIGINSYEDTIVKDINGERNVAGAGINMAQRIMNAADGGNILMRTEKYNGLTSRKLRFLAALGTGSAIPSPRDCFAEFMLRNEVLAMTGLIRISK